MISAALIVSGITSLIQVTRFSVKAPSFYHANRIFLGTGLVSLMGTSFTFLPIAQTSIRTMIESGTCYPPAPHPCCQYSLFPRQSMLALCVFARTCAFIHGVHACRR